MARKRYYNKFDYTYIEALLFVYLFFKFYKYWYIFLTIGILFIIYLGIRKIIDLDLGNTFKTPKFYYKGNSSQKKLENLKLQGNNIEKIKTLSSGLYGENRLLYNLEHSNIPMYILYDVNLEFDNFKSQIDVIVITKRGIYVLESKNLKGNLNIDEFGNFVRKVNYNKFGIRNPIAQNEEHIIMLKKILKREKIKCNLQSLVVLTNDNGYVNFKKESKKYSKWVTRNDQLINTLTELERKKHIIYNENKIKKICDAILKYKIEYEEKIISQEEIEIVELELDIDKLEISLKEWRKKKALIENIPPYVIFNDETLKTIATIKPKSLSDLLSIKGLGEKRILKYGNEILKIVNNDLEIIHI